MLVEVPYDHRWGSAKDVEKEFGLAPPLLKAAHIAGWVKAVQPGWVDDMHRCQTLYCFNDVQRYLLDVAHEPTYDYTKHFWTSGDISRSLKDIPEGPFRKRRKA